MLTLELSSKPELPVEVEGLTPCQLAGRTRSEIETVPVAVGNRLMPTGELFRISGTADDQQLQFFGETGCLKRLGERMQWGLIEVHGDVGMHAGAMMTGGRLVVHGSADNWLGAEMQAGELLIHGNAGHQVAAAYRGSRHGMRGGKILILGNAGDELGYKMRRGLVAVAGSTGSFTGSSLIAGSILVGSAGRRCGAGMKRGSIWVFEPSTEMPPGFEPSFQERPIYFSLLAKAMRESDPNWLPIAEKLAAPNWQCHRGDMVHGGHGEIWQGSHE